jgi:hypothetical protein
MLRFTLASAVVAALAVAFASAAYAAPPPPTLTGETLSSEAPQLSNVSCDPNGRSSFTFRADGTAAGPYPGTFTEVGNAVIGPQTHDFGGPFPDAAWVSLNAAYTIDSPEGRVVGEKHLADATYSFPTNEVVCATFPNPTAPTLLSGHAYAGTSDRMAYKALILGRSKSCADSGQAYITLGDVDYVSSEFGHFTNHVLFEEYTSTQNRTHC